MVCLPKAQTDTIMHCSFLGVQMFWRHCSRAYCEPVSHPPLTLVANEPRARVSPLVYLPPALRPGALGWHPQQGRVWEKYGIPRYYF